MCTSSVDSKEGTSISTIASTGDTSSPLTLIFSSGIKRSSPLCSLILYCVEDAAVAGFHAVADVRDGAADVHAQRVLQVRGVHDVFDVDREHIVRSVGHAFCLSEKRCGLLLNFL